MADPREYHFNLPPSRRPHDVLIHETWYPGVGHYWPRCTSSRLFDPIMGIRAIVIHATGGHSSADAMLTMRTGNGSWHWLVPDENEAQHGQFVWACAPEARAAWHVRNSKFHPKVNGGKRRVNHWSLGIEIVNSQPTENPDPFSQWQIEATAAIVRYCWAKYPNLKHVLSHAALDPARSSDPGEQFPWDRFKQAVLEGTGDLAENPLVSAATPMRQLGRQPRPRKYPLTA